MSVIAEATRIVELENGLLIFCDGIDGDEYLNPLKIKLGAEPGLTFQPLALFSTDDVVRVRINPDKVVLTYQPDELFVKATEEFREHFAKLKSEALAGQPEPSHLKVVPNGPGE